MPQSPKTLKLPQSPSQSQQREAELMTLLRVKEEEIASLRQQVKHQNRLLELTPTSPKQKPTIRQAPTLETTPVWTNPYRQPR